MIRGSCDTSSAYTYIDRRSSFKEDVNTRLTQISEIIAGEAQTLAGNNERCNQSVEMFNSASIHIPILTASTRASASALIPPIGLYCYTMRPNLVARRNWSVSRRSLALSLTLTSGISAIASISHAADRAVIHQMNVPMVLASPIIYSSL